MQCRMIYHVDQNQTNKVYDSSMRRKQPISFSENSPIPQRRSLRQQAPFTMSLYRTGKAEAVA
uniref:Uncharacterized protein n=1 Tax=Arundo donax TaxID=35708 RepID=A0A0A9BPM3_ARUDO